MSLALRSPRRSALGVSWLDDYSRGRLGVAKGQGDIIEAAGNPIAFSGPWITFPNNVGTYVDYPRHHCLGATGVTIGCDIDAVTTTGVNQMIVGQYDTAGNQEFAFYFFATGEVMLAVNISGTVRTAFTMGSQFGARAQVVGTWGTGSALLIYVNGALAMMAGPAYAGTISDFGEALRVGLSNDGAWPLNGAMANLFFEFRQFSAAEVLQHFETRSFR